MKPRKGIIGCSFQVVTDIDRKKALEGRKRERKEQIFTALIIENEHCVWEIFCIYFVSIYIESMGLC